MAYLIDPLASKVCESHGEARRPTSCNTSGIDSIDQDPHLGRAMVTLIHGNLIEFTNFILSGKETQLDELFNLTTMSQIDVSFKTRFPAQLDALASSYSYISSTVTAACAMRPIRRFGACVGGSFVAHPIKPQHKRARKRWR